MLTIAPRLVEVLVGLVIAYVATLWLTLVIWAFRDIQARSTDLFVQTIATLFVALFNLPGLVLYLILRPHETLAEQYERSLEEETLLQDLKQELLCPSCQHAIQPDYLMCPRCRLRLKRPCSECERPMDLDWTTCPYCTTPVAAAVA